MAVDLRRHRDVTGLRKALNARSGLLLTFDSLLRMGIGFVVAIVIARGYGPSGLGAITAASAWVTVILGFSALGLTGVMVRELVNRPDERGVLISSIITIKAVVGTVLYMVMLLLLHLLGQGADGVTILAAIMGIGFIFSSLDPVDSLYNASKSFLRLVILRAAAMAVATTVKLGAVYLDLGLKWVAVGYAIDYGFVYLLPLLDFLRRRNRLAGGSYTLRTDLRVGVRLIRETWPVLVSGAFAQVNLKIDSLMLAAMSSLYAVGIYSAAARLSEAWSVLAMALVTAAFPDLIRQAREDTSAYADGLRRLFRKLIAFSAVGAVAISLLSTTIITTVYGDEYSASAQVLAIHVAGGIFLFIRTAVSRWLIIERLLIFSLVSHGLGAATNVGLNLVLIPRFEEMGAAVASVVSYSVSGVLFLALSRSTRPLLFLIFWSVIPGDAARSRCQVHAAHMPSRDLEMTP